jgi:hypothetical protein
MSRADFSRVSILEISTTRDHAVTFEDGSSGTAPTRPYGRGWRVKDSHRDRHTVWWRARAWGQWP